MDSNYWVTPLWIPQYTLSGFYSPVDMSGVFNTVKGGSTVPLKFEVFWGGDEQTDVAVVDSFKATPITCPSGSVTTDHDRGHHDRRDEPPLRPYGRPVRPELEDAEEGRVLRGHDVHRGRLLSQCQLPAEVEDLGAPIIWRAGLRTGPPGSPQ